MNGNNKKHVCIRKEDIYMNKIYKVVWNKARNCYVVASEFAKNHQTGSSRIKVASVAAVMAATMLTIGTGVIYAADVTDTDVKESKETILFENTTDTATKLNDPNLKHNHPGSWVHGHTDTCGELTYNTTLTIGDINKVADKLVTNDKMLYGQGIQKVTMDNGRISLLRNDNSNIANNIILTENGGTEGKDTSVTVQVGDALKKLNTGSVVSANTDANGKATGLTINGTSYDIKAGSDYHWDLRIKGKTEKEVKNDAKVVFGNSDDNITVTDDPLGDPDKKNLHVSVGLNSTVTIGTKKDGNYNKEAITINGNTGHITGLTNTTLNADGFGTQGREATEEQLQKVAQSVKTYTAGDNVTISDDGKISATDTKYSAGNNVKIDKDNKISVDLSQYVQSDDVAVVYDKNKTSLKSTNAKGVEENSIALGDGASVVWGSHGQGGVAIGNNSRAGYKGISLGNKAGINNDKEKDLSSREGAIIIGDSANSQGLYTTVVGTDSRLAVDGTPYTIFGKAVIVQGALSTSYGAMNTMTSNNKEVYSGIANSVIGSVNTVTNSNGVTIQGTGNTVTGAYKDMKINALDLLKFQKGDYSSLANKDSGAVAVIGGANTISDQTSSTVIGFGNTLTGNNSTGTAGVFTAGSHNTLTNVSNSLIMGDNNKLENRTNVISLGNKNTVEADNAVAIGNGSTVTAEGGVALGIGSVANTNKGVKGYLADDTDTSATWKATGAALSVGSKEITRQITNVAAGKEDTDAVNVAQLKKVQEAITGDVSNKTFGLSDDSGTTKVTNTLGNTVQVKGANGITSTVKDGALEIGLGNDIVINGKDGKDGHIGVNGVDGKSGVGIDGKDGISIKGADGKDGVTIKGIDGKDGVDGAEGHIGLNGKDGMTDIWTTAGKPGLNGKDGETMTRVVYKDPQGNTHEVATIDDGLKFQGDRGGAIAKKLNETLTIKGNADEKAELSDGNIGVVGENGGLTVKLNKDLTGLNSAKFGDTTINAGGLTVGRGTNGLEFSKNRVSVGGQQIHDVANGKDDMDAVNVSQLNKAANSAKTTVAAGKNIKVSADTKDDGHTEYNVSLDDDITLGNNASDTFVTVSGTKGTIWASHSISAGNVMMDGDSDTIIGLKNTTWNGTTDDTSRAATEGQLQQVANAATNNDKRLVQNPNGGDGSYQVKENGDVTLRVEDSNKNGYDVTIKDVASKKELDKVKEDVGDVNKFHDDIKNTGEDGKPTHTSVVDAVNNLDTKVNNIQSDVKNVTEEAKKHSSVSTGNGLDLDITDNNGQKDYKVSLKDDFTLGGNEGQNGNIDFKGSEGNITASGTITANTVSAGKTSISDSGLKIGDNTSLTESSLTIGGNTYITDKGIDANKQKISNVADGDISKDSKDAVNGSQLYATNEAIANNYNNITNLNGKISNLDNRVNKVGAGAAALAALHPLDFDPDAKWDFAAGYGNYRGAGAAAVGAYYRPNEDTMFSVGGTFGNGENMVNAGVSFKLGSGSSHVSTSRVAMAKEIKELRSELEAMKSAMLDANAGKKVDTSKLQLFPDVPQNHWAYEYVAQLAGNGMIEGYPDGNFAGDRPMTRYEFAAILYRAMTKGAVLSDKILNEFSHELEYFTVDTVAKDKAGNPTIQRVRTVKENKNK